MSTRSALHFMINANDPHIPSEVSSVQATLGGQRIAWPLARNEFVSLERGCVGIPERKRCTPDWEPIQVK